MILEPIKEKTNEESEREYIYMIAYTFKRGLSQKGTGNAVIRISEPIKSSEHIRDIEAAIGKEFNMGNVVIINYILMSTEDKAEI